MKKRKRKKIRALLIILCLVTLAVYGGVKGGQYLAYKLTKPIGEDKSPLQGAEGSGEYGSDTVLSENEMVTLTATVTEFVNAEHMKKADKLTEIVSPDYYNTLTKNIKSLSAAEVVLQDINFKSLAKDEVVVEVTYIKNSKKYTETVTLKSSGSSWKVAMVER